MIEFEDLSLEVSWILSVLNDCDENSIGFCAFWVTDENYSFYGSVVEQSFWCQINYFQLVAIVIATTLKYFGAFEHSISNYLFIIQM